MIIPPVSVPANSHIFVNLSDWANIGGVGFQKGSLKLFHTGKDLIIGSQVYLEESANSLSFEERLVELGKFDSRRFEAIWAMPRNQTQVTIILSNTSDTTLSVNAKLSKKPHHTGETQTFTLSPHQTRVLDLRNDFADENQFANSDVVGIALEHTGEKGALKAHGQIKDAPIGYSNIISFNNPNSGKSNELHGTGLHLGTIANEELEPVIAIKNVGTAQANVTIKVPYTRTDGTSGTVNLNSINLSAGEMRLVNMNPVIQRSRQEQIQIAGIELSHAAAPGSIIVQAQSIGESKNQVYRVPMADPLAQTSSTGGYPWRIEPTSRTVSYIKNMTDLEQEYVAYLSWENGGKYMIGIKNLAPHKTIEIDVKKLRDEQVADVFGRFIPLNITNGQIQWSLLTQYQTDNPKNDKFALFGRSEQIDTTNKTSSSYACQNCCESTRQGFISTDPNPDPNAPINYYPSYEFETGSSVQFYAYEALSFCYSEQNTPPEIYPRTLHYPYYWGSGNSNVASVNSSGLVTIEGAGNGGIEAHFSVSNSFANECLQLVSSSEICEDKNKRKEEETEVSSVINCGCNNNLNPIVANANIRVIPRVTDVSAVGAIRVARTNGNRNFIHFVTPRGGNNDQITLTATLSENNQQTLDNISWEGATESTTNPLEATVPKSAASKTVVKIKYGNDVIKELRVWVVWATITSTIRSLVSFSANTGNPSGMAVGVKGGYNFVHTIQPSTIITDADRPSFSGSNTNPPPAGNNPISGVVLSGGANRKWDSSRQIRFRILNPDNISPNDTTFFTYGGFPNNALNYPVDDALGNDDVSVEDETNNPYSNNGTLTGLDEPITAICDRAGVINNTFESRLQFREFTRLEIEGNWYRISDFYLWKFHRRQMNNGQFWENDNSILSLDNSGF